jgi:hypothetical protein
MKERKKHMLCRRNYRVNASGLPYCFIAVLFILMGCDSDDDYPRCRMSGHSSPANQNQEKSECSTPAPSPAGSSASTPTLGLKDLEALLEIASSSMNTLEGIKLPFDALFKIPFLINQLSNGLADNLLQNQLLQSFFKHYLFFFTNTALGILETQKCINVQMNTFDMEIVFNQCKAKKVLPLTVNGEVKIRLEPDPVAGKLTSSIELDQLTINDAVVNGKIDSALALKQNEKFIESKIDIKVVADHGIEVMLQAEGNLSIDWQKPAAIYNAKGKGAVNGRVLTFTLSDIEISEKSSLTDLPQGKMEAVFDGKLLSIGVSYDGQAADKLQLTIDGVDISNILLAMMQQQMGIN